MSRVPGGSRTADALVFALFLAVPLIVSPLFWDQYVTIKWYALEALAALWLAVEVWICGSSGIPSFLRRWRWLVAALAVLELASVFRAGAPSALAPLVERTSVCALALCAYWYFRRNRSSLGVPVAATALALAMVTAVGLAQAGGHDPLSALDASDGRGSLFGNANMAAQYAGLSVLLLLSALSAAPGRPRWRWGFGGLEWLLLVAAVVWLGLLSTRSVFLALGAGLAAWWLARHPVRWRRAAAGAALGAVVLALLWWLGTHEGGAGLRANKAASIGHRLAVWKDTARLIRDHPLGVGAGLFEDAFRPYQATGSSAADENQVYRHPHDEYLRLAAEEGLPFLILSGALVGLLGRRAARAGRSADDPPAPSQLLLGSWSAFLLVEAVFQFPFSLAFGALSLALLAGLALAQAEEGLPPAAPSARHAGWCAGATAVAVFVLIGMAFVAVSEWLFVSAQQGERAQERACTLDARNLPACVMASWLRGTRGDLPGARGQLLRVLERAPHYPPAMKLLAEQAQVAGDHEAACVYLWTYDQLFRGQSSVHGDLMATCDEDARRQAARRVPTPHYDRFPAVERPR